MILEGANDTFRGFFVQARGSDDSQLGQFKAVDGISQIRQCGGGDVSIYIANNTIFEI